MTLFLVTQLTGGVRALAPHRSTACDPMSSSSQRWASWRALRCSSPCSADVPVAPASQSRNTEVPFGHHKDTLPYPPCRLECVPDFGSAQSAARRCQVSRLCPPMPETSASAFFGERRSVERRAPTGKKSLPTQAGYSSRIRRRWSGALHKGNERKTGELSAPGEPSAAGPLREGVPRIEKGHTPRIPKSASQIGRPTGMALARSHNSGSPASGGAQWCRDLSFGS